MSKLKDIKLLSKAQISEDPNPARILTKAALRAADQLGLVQGEFAQIIGVSPAFVSKLKNGDATLKLTSKNAELAKHLVRVYRSLDAIVAGDQATARAWMRNGNIALNAVPAEYLMTVAGLMDTVNYLDQRRAPL